jgi:outer membrane protein TolC
MFASILKPLLFKSGRWINAKVFIWFAVSSSLLVSCSLTPKYTTPKVGNVSENTWRDNPWTEATPLDIQDKGQWWLMFHDETLNALELALEKDSPSLAIALYRYDQATAYLIQTQSQELPSIDASESTTQNRQSHNRPLRGSNQPDYYKAYTGMIASNYELDFWGRVRSLVASAQAQAKASEADLQTEKLSLQSKLAQVYFQLRGNDKQTLVLAKSIKGYERAYELIKNRYEAGIASGVDLSRAQSQLSSAKAEVSELNIQRALYEHALAVLIGASAQSFTLKASPSLDGTMSVQTNAPLNLNEDSNDHSNRTASIFNVKEQDLNTYLKGLKITTPPVIPTGLPSTLLQRRPDIAAAERRTAAANERIGVAKAAFFPSFSIGASVGYQNTGGPAWMSEPNSFWSIGPAASFNLLDNGLRQAQLSIAKSALDQAGAEYRLVVLTAYQQVQDAMVKLSEFKNEINDRGLAAFSANRAMQLATSRYKDGAVNYLEVITAQTTALQAERSLISLDTARLITSIDLIKALGGGWNELDVRIGKN